MARELAHPLDVAGLPVELEGLDRAELVERAQARAELELREASGDLLRWIPLQDGTLAAPRHLAPVCTLWDRIQKGVQVFACVEAPPRHAKTTTAYHGIARIFRFRPKSKVIFGTYNATFARECSQAARQVALRAGVFVDRVKREKFGPLQSLHYWQTHKLGSAKFIGRGQGVIGSGADLWVIDDPFKGREEAESQAESDACWRWVTSDCFNRLEPGGSFLLEHQRWNDLDPIGRMRELIERQVVPDELAAVGGVQWEFISLPAIKDDGAPLWGDRWTLRSLAIVRVVVQEYNWWSQYMQQPRQKGGALFRGPLGRWLSERDAHGRELVIAVLGELIPVPVGFEHCTLVLSCDSAGTTTDGADWTAWVLLALRWTPSDAAMLEGIDPVLAQMIGINRGLELQADVLRVWRHRMTSPDVVDFTERLMGSLPGVPIVFETQGGDGRAQAQFLTQRNPGAPIHMITTTSNKATRNTPAANSSNRGRLRVPLAGAEWTREYERELLRFTGVGSGKDDQADATGHGWNFGLKVGPPSPVLFGGARGSGGGGF